MNSMNAKKYFLIFVLLLASIESVASESPFSDRYTAIRLDMNGGLPSNFVDDVYIDSDGFLWIATSGGGLCRYDGYELITFDTSSETPIKSNFVKSILEDDFRRLWIASEGGIDILDLSSLRTLNLDVPAIRQSERRACYSMTKDALGRMWLKYEHSLWLLSFDSDGSISGPIVFDGPGLPSGNSNFKDIDMDGSVWGSLGGRLHKISLSPSGKLEPSPVATDMDLGNDTYVSDFLSLGREIWISAENGLYKLHRSTGQWKHYTWSASNSRSLTQNFVTGLSIDSEGELIISTLRGLNVFNPITDDFERVGKDVINCVSSYDNHILLGSELEGLTILIPKQLSITNLANDKSDGGSLSPGPVNAVWQDGDGRLWVGNMEGGLNIKEPWSKKFIHITQSSGGLCHNSVSSFAFDGRDRLYVGTWGGGIDVVSNKAPYRVLEHLPSLGAATSFIGALEYDKRNKLLWVCSNQGIFLYNPATKEYKTALDEAATGCIGSAIDKSGRLWVGCAEGLYVFDLNKRSPRGDFSYVHYRYKLDNPQSEINEQICSILPVSDSLLYLGSNGLGFYSARLQGDGSFSFTNYSTKNGLSNNRVKGLVTDANGYLWISTDNGLNVFYPSREIISVYNTKEGLTNTQFFWNSTFAGTDGLLYFGHTEGLSVVDPSRTERSTLNRPLRFTRIYTPEKLYLNPRTEEIRVHQRDRGISIQFALLHPNVSSKVVYQCKLDGYDPVWRQIPSYQREAMYSSLPGGKYKFNVRALNREGDVIDSASLTVKVTPYFYNTWWFRIFIFLAVLCVVWFVTFWQTRKVTRRNEILERTVRERTNEITVQKKLVEKKAEELHQQNAILRRQNEELASRRILFDSEKVNQDNRGDDFMIRVLDLVRQHYKNPDLDVTGFCKLMGMSKTLLNNRLHEASGQSISQFIRVYRLSVANEMLKNNHHLNVSEVAYEVGFNDPKYFTRCFTSYFGRTPSSVTKE